MSYDIDILLPTGELDEDGDPKHRTLSSLNWLRNPFGLCNFAEDNVGDGNHSLWHVCNDHAYDEANNLDRQRFLAVVSDYWDRIRGLQRGYFHFTFGAYVHFVPQHYSRMLLNPHQDRHEWSDDGEILKIDIENFRGSKDFGWAHGKSALQHYKDWFAKLLEAAQTMQDPKTIVRITN